MIFQEAETSGDEIWKRTNQVAVVGKPQGTNQNLALPAGGYKKGTKGHVIRQSSTESEITKVASCPLRQITKHVNRSDAPDCTKKVI